jgi:transcriptional regulator
MPDANRTVLQGTVDLLILKTLTWGPRHGYAIARWIEETTNDVLRIEEGSLYPALYRMQKRGWIKSGWGESDTGKRIRIYSLTPMDTPASRSVCSRSCLCLAVTFLSRYVSSLGAIASVNCSTL